MDLLRVPLDELAARARVVRDAGRGTLVTYSPKVFVPLTTLCRDVCHYCTFARPPVRGERAYLSIDEVLAIARAGEAAGCSEALFTLGDRPELRYRVAREELSALGVASTVEYLAVAARAVLEQTSLLPHLNPGVLTRPEIDLLRAVAPSMGLMLETTAARLAERGGPHFGSPDKLPARRLETLRLAGQASVPFTTGILVGIGETRAERLEALRAIAQAGPHVQEVIVQNFRAKPGTRMAHVPDAPLEELLWTIAVARIVLPPEVAVQAPPNLSDDLTALLDAQSKIFPSNQTILFGFSQGCLMTLETGLRYQKKLAGLIGISGYLHDADALAKELSPVAREQRVLWTHGSRDPLIPLPAVRDQAQKMKAAGLHIDWHEFPKEHTIIPREIETIRQFILDSLGLAQI